MIYDATYFHATAKHDARSALLDLPQLNIRYHLRLGGWNKNTEAQLLETLARARENHGPMVLDIKDLDEGQQLNPRRVGLETIVETARKTVALQDRVTNFLGGVRPQIFTGITSGWYRTMWLEPTAHRLALRPLTYDVETRSKVGYIEHQHTIHLPFRPVGWTGASAKWDHAIAAATATLAGFVHDHSKLGVLWLYPNEYDTAEGFARQLGRVLEHDLSAAIWIHRDEQISDDLRQVIEEAA